MSESGPRSGARVLLFGAGTMGSTHAAAWQRLGCQVACVVDLQRGAGTALALKAGAHHCPSPQAALDCHPRFDIADIAVPTFAHGEVLEALPKGRRLVVLEKPIERDPARAERILAAARERDLALFVAQVVRFFPGYRALYDTIRSHSADAVHHMRLRRIGPAPHGMGDWFLDETKSGGIFLDLLIHDLDFCLWTFGPPDWVMARVSTSPTTDPGAARHATAILSYESRRIVHLEGSWMFPEPFSTRAEVDAEWGTLVLDSEQERTLQVFAAPAGAAGPRPGERAMAPPAREPYAEGLNDPYTLELKAALEAYRSGLPLPVTPADALRAVRLGDLCRRAAAVGEPLAWPGDHGSDPQAGAV